ncbi:hypothetical protein TKK_0001454 [Trichogramma kaykai]|uniref:SID1 transmembrane family member 1 n=1 Tax=Trichogramma kaykai TaxID=54128 RepID=A0ABD2X1I8_9HYME
MKTNYKIKCFYDITLLIVLVFSHTSSCLITNLNLYPTIISATFDLPYEREVDNQREYIFIYAEEDIKNTEGSKLTVESEDATLENPLIVVVRQKSGVLSWQVPLLPDIGENVDSADFSNKTSRTLCPSHHYKAIRNSTDVDKYATVTISTDSPKTISFKLRLSRLTDFYLRIDEKKTFAITPSEPIFYAYDYGDNAENSTLLVKVSSTKGTAKKCMTFSIQNATCPVFDLEKDISFDGYRQTVSQQGGMTIQRRNYPAGFFIVLIVNADDKLCHEDDEDAPQGRQKIVSLVIEKGITNKEYYIATFSTVIIIIAFCAMFFGITIYFEFHDVRRFKHAVDSNSVTDPDSIEFGAMRPRPNAEQDQNNESPPEAQHQRQQSQQEQQQAVESPQVESASDVVDRSAIGTVVNRERAIHKLVLFELSKKEPRKLREESQLYMYYLMTIAIFYAAPVVQLVITDQIMLHMTGNHDLCYYNFLCSHPLMVFSDFNHIFSNLGYVMLGALFMTIVYTRERKCADWDACNIERGIPPHYGLYYSMGFALIMEGVMSGSYHVCPSHSAFQFDTSFMYIIAVLCIVKIYQNRHPDINAKAPTIFGVLSMTILLVIYGVVKGSGLTFRIIFSLIHLGLCIFLSAQIYHVGKWRLDKGVFQRMAVTLKPDYGSACLFKPLHRKRFCLLAIGNFFNIGAAIYGVIFQVDFAKYLLAILLSNLSLYMVFYIYMKIHYGEKLLPHTIVYMTLSLILWFVALYFFYSKTTSWSKTPASSKEFNRPCTLVFYDFHDIWHFLSAAAMFFSFMVLLTLDDPLAGTHCTQIPVF